MPKQRQPRIREEERMVREAALDNTVEDSFPASDPPSSTPNPKDPDALEPDKPRDDPSFVDKPRRQTALNRGRA